MNANYSAAEKAYDIAALAHEGQFRKISGEHAITHASVVADMVRECGAEDTTIAAAYLHDVLEDAPDAYSEEEMLNGFGSVVTELVTAVTERRLTPEGQPIPWIDRKKSYIENIKHAPSEAVLISAADKVHNLTSMLDDYNFRGEDILDSFNAPLSDQYWYYATLNDIFKSRLGADHPLVTRLAVALESLSKILPHE